MAREDEFTKLIFKCYLIGIAGYNEFVSLIAEMTEGNIQDIDNYIHRKFLLSSNIIDEGDGILIIK